MKQQIKERLGLRQLTPLSPLGTRQGGTHRGITGNPGLQTGVRSGLSLLLAPEEEYLI